MRRRRRPNIDPNYSHLGQDRIRGAASAFFAVGSSPDKFIAEIQALAAQPEAARRWLEDRGSASTESRAEPSALRESAIVGPANNLIKNPRFLASPDRSPKRDAVWPRLHMSTYCDFDTELKNATYTVSGIEYLTAEFVLDFVGTRGLGSGVAEEVVHKIRKYNSGRPEKNRIAKTHFLQDLSKAVVVVSVDKAKKSLRREQNRQSAYNNAALKELAQKLVDLRTRLQPSQLEDLGSAFFEFENLTASATFCIASDRAQEPQMAQYGAAERAGGSAQDEDETRSESVYDLGMDFTPGLKRGTARQRDLDAALVLFRHGLSQPNPIVQQGKKDLDLFQETPLWDCKNTITKTNLPPPFFELSDRVVADLLDLVNAKFISAWVLYANWPNVFNSDAQPHAHRQPMGSASWILIDNPDRANPQQKSAFYMAYETYILCGSDGVDQIRGHCSPSFSPWLVKGGGKNGSYERTKPKNPNPESKASMRRAKSKQEAPETVMILSAWTGERPANVENPRLVPREGCGAPLTGWDFDRMTAEDMHNLTETELAEYNQYKDNLRNGAELAPSAIRATLYRNPKDKKPVWQQDSVALPPPRIPQSMYDRLERRPLTSTPAKVAAIPSMNVQRHDADAAPDTLVPVSQVRASLEHILLKEHEENKRNEAVLNPLAESMLQHAALGLRQYTTVQQVISSKRETLNRKIQAANAALNGWGASPVAIPQDQPVAPDVERLLKSQVRRLHTPSSGEHLVVLRDVGMEMMASAMADLSADYSYTPPVAATQQPAVRQKGNVPESPSRRIAIPIPRLRSSLSGAGAPHTINSPLRAVQSASSSPMPPLWSSGPTDGANRPYTAGSSTHDAQSPTDLGFMAHFVGGDPNASGYADKPFGGGYGGGATAPSPPFANQQPLRSFRGSEPPRDYDIPPFSYDNPHQIAQANAQRASPFMAPQPMRPIQYGHLDSPVRAASVSQLNAEAPAYSPSQQYRPAPHKAAQQQAQPPPQYPPAHQQRSVSRLETLTDAELRAALEKEGWR